MLERTAGKEIIQASTVRAGTSVMGEKNTFINIPWVKSNFFGTTESAKPPKTEAEVHKYQIKSYVHRR